MRPKDVSRFLYPGSYNRLLPADAQDQAGMPSASHSLDRLRTMIGMQVELDDIRRRIETHSPNRALKRLAGLQARFKAL